MSFNSLLNFQRITVIPCCTSDALSTGGREAQKRTFLSIPEISLAQLSFDRCIIPNTDHAQKTKEPKPLTSSSDAQLPQSNDVTSTMEISMRNAMDPSSLFIISVKRSHIDAQALADK